MGFFRTPTCHQYLLLVLSALSACAAPTYKAGLRISPRVESDVAHTESRFEGIDKTSLLEQSWRPKTGRSRAALILIHGLKDHSDHYADFAQELTRHGVSVYAMDLRGHGDSAGDRVWIDRFDQYIDDLEIFYEKVAAQEKGKPIFLFGHSMGGAVVTLFVLDKKPKLRGLILSAPALKPGSDVSGFLIGVTKILGSITPSLAVLDLKNKYFSRDPAVLEALAHDPLVYQGSGPARTGKQLLKAIARIQNNLELLTLPYLNLHGSADRITNPSGSEELYARSKSPDKTLRIYPDLYHDLVHEPEKARVKQDIFTWIDARL